MSIQPLERTIAGCLAALESSQVSKFTQYPSIRDMLSKHPDRTLKPKEARRLYDLRSDLYLAAGQRGIETPLHELEEMISVRADSDARIIETYIRTCKDFQQDRRNDRPRRQINNIIRTLNEYKEIAHLYESHELERLMSSWDNMKAGLKILTGVLHLKERKEEGGCGAF